MVLKSLTPIGLNHLHYDTALNIGGWAQPSRLAPTFPCSNDDNFSAAQSEAKQLCRPKAQALSLRRPYCDTSTAKVSTAALYVIFS